MSNYKLTYFNGKGRAEVARWILFRAGVEFEDKRLSREEFADVKETMPFGQLPTLEVDGIVITQTQAIIRFLGSRFGLHGKSDVECALIDSVMGSVDDTTQPMLAIFMEQDQQTKEARRSRFENEQLPKSLGYLEKMLEKNSAGEGYFVGDTMTIADMHFAHCMSLPGTMLQIDTKLENFPKLQALKEKVENDPKVAEWIKNRPETPF